jgi:2-polyprenyl-3-methyl-5-hydroxy-6-metoxy-1,4-benzoquinol methylase
MHEGQVIEWAEESPKSQPSLESQQAYWDTWNVEVRADEITPYMERLVSAAVKRVERLDGRLRMLDIGCGTGWIAHALAESGEVCGIDLSPQAVVIASRRCPGGEFHCGDFLEVDFSGSFDVVVTADTIAHVTDQARFVNRIAALLRSGGKLILMSQNAYALNRSAWVRPVPGQIRRWPSLRELRSYLSRDFEIEEVTTAAPEQATDGIYRLFNAQIVLRGLYSLLGKDRTQRLYEKLRLGSEWVIVARRQ